MNLNILSMYSILLKEGREKLPAKHHPWVFSNAIEKTEPAFTAPGWAEVRSSKGAFIAWGWYDEKSNVLLRLVSWDRNAVMGEEHVRALVRDAVLRRRELLRLPDTTAIRLIHGEADLIPGLAADCYAREIRLIVSARFSDHFLPVIAEELDRLLHPALIEAVTDRYYGPIEGLSEKERYFIGGKEARKPEERKSLQFKENGLVYELVPGRGQKSGFYCDQRDNREIVGKYAKGRKTLDLFSYTGGFTLHALREGAESVTAVDSSGQALRHLLYQVNLNEDKGLVPKGSREKVTIEEADAFDYLRESVKEGQYDLIILDPPKLAKNKGALEKAVKAYKDVNRVAMLKIRRGGIIATFSCSAALSREEFRLVLSWAAADAGKEIQILRTLSAGEDHPVRLSFPESEYLKGFVLRVL